MLKQVRQKIIQNLWCAYHDTTPHVREIEKALENKQITNLPLDHLAIIDLPGPHTGIPVLKEVFSILGYTVRGTGYLPEKQNDFTWLAENDSCQHLASDVLPQVVVADFRLEEMPADVRAIISKYSAQAKPAPVNEMRALASQAENSVEASNRLIDIVTDYFTGRDWPLPTIAEFNCVQKFNELIAWVLIYGRRPNHFTVSVHLLNHFSDLPAFNAFVEQDARLALNHEGGVIKGSVETGIAQGSTVGITETVQMADGSIDLPTGFVEFVWRYPVAKHLTKPERWEDFFTGFVAQYANHVIESLYTDNNHS